MPARPKNQVPDKVRYQTLQERRLELAGPSSDAIAAGNSLNPFNLSQLFECHSELAGFALAFEADAAEVAGHFHEALEAARLWFDAGRLWQPAAQPDDADVTITHVGGSSFEVTEMLPRAETGWMQDWEVGSFSMALSTFLAFGTFADVRRASAIPEVAYRNPNVVADPADFAQVRAIKAWGLGRADDVRMACNEVLECPAPTDMPAKWSRGLVKSREPGCAQARALLALVDRDPDWFFTALTEHASAYKERFARASRSGVRFYTMTGLALARMAKSVGIDTPDTPLIPTRFLPNAMTRLAESR